MKREKRHFMSEKNFWRESYKKHRKMELLAVDRKNWKLFNVKIVKKSELYTMDNSRCEYIHLNYALAIICTPSGPNHAAILQRETYFPGTMYRNLKNCDW